MSYAEYEARDVRLLILVELAAAQESQHTLNHRVLQSRLDKRGLQKSLDMLRTQIAWLAEQGLVAQVDTPPLLIATLTERGLDVAEGRAKVPGVERLSRV